MALNNILMNSLDISVASAIKHFMVCNLNDYISVTRDVNVPLSANETEGVLGFFGDCEAYLANAREGELEWDGDNAITGRYTLGVIDYLTELQEHRERLLAHRGELLLWAAEAQVETEGDEIDDEEFFAILYHAYAKLRTEMLENFYQEEKVEAIARYGIAQH
jgi:hypothetical protein